MLDSLNYEGSNSSSSQYHPPPPKSGHALKGFSTSTSIINDRGEGKILPTTEYMIVRKTRTAFCHLTWSDLLRLTPLCEQAWSVNRTGHLCFFFGSSDLVYAATDATRTKTTEVFYHRNIEGTGMTTLVTG